MKRILAIVLSILIIAALAACGNESDPAPGNGGSNAGSGADANTGAFNADQVVSNIDVKVESYKGYSSSYLVLILTNNAGVTCDLTIEADFYGADDKIVGTKSDTIRAFVNGTTVISSLMSEEEFSKYDYKLTAEETGDVFVSVDQDLTTQVTTTSKKAIVSVTNNGSVKADNVTIYVLFYKGDTLIDCGWGLMSDVAPGATMNEEVSCWADDGFDSVKAYAHCYNYAI